MKERLQWTKHLQTFRTSCPMKITVLKTTTKWHQQLMVFQTAQLSALLTTATTRRFVETFQHRRPHTNKWPTKDQAYENIMARPRNNPRS